MIYIDLVNQSNCKAYQVRHTLFSRGILGIVSVRFETKRRIDFTRVHFFSNQIDGCLIDWYCTAENGSIPERKSVRRPGNINSQEGLPASWSFLPPLPREPVRHNEVPPALVELACKSRALHLFFVFRNLGICKYENNLKVFKCSFMVVSMPIFATKFLN